jgi:hypothetical protein
MSPWEIDRHRLQRPGDAGAIVSRPWSQALTPQERDERQRAVRALLRQPLLAPGGPTREAFTLVQKHRD